MPLSSVLGASSVIKPGVVTSSTRPSVPYIGQLIYETDTNRLAAYNGSAWVTQNGLQYVTGASFSAVTSVSLPTNTFTSTYRNYKVIFHLTAASTASTITMRARAAGSDKTGGDYWQASSGFNVGGTANSQSDSGTTSFSMGGVDSAFPNYALILDVIGPQVGLPQFFMLGTLFYFDGTTQTGRSISCRKYESPAVAIDSLSFIKTSGTFTGIYRVYGYSES